MKLDGILGQEHLKKKIYDSIEKKIFPQSKILVDRDGYGGLNFAIEIARGLLEVDKNYKGEILNHPDLYFSYPTFADKQTSPDLLDLWIDLIKKNVYIDFNDWKNISVDSKGKNTEGKIRKAEIDLIFSKAHLKSFIGGAKVFIIWNMQQLDNYGQNKLLKLLEEPPNDTFFILVTESLDSLLPTIISRCQISNLIPVNFNEHKYFLENLVDSIDYDLIVKSSRGSVSRSMNYISENASSISHEQNFVDCLRFAFLAKKSKKAVLDLTKWSEKMSSNSRIQQKEFLSFCSFLVREAMLVSYKSQNLTSFISSSDFKIEKLSPFIHSQNLIEIIDLIEDSYYSISRNVNSKIVFTSFAIKMTKLINQSED